MNPDPAPAPDLTVPPPGLRPGPQELDLCLTGRCNLSCRYCFYADDMAARSDLPAERWQAFFVEAGRLGVRKVCLSGGEVFMRPELFELVDGIIANKMRYAIITNGTLITDEALKAFESGKRRLRLDYIQVSIDGSRAEIHDKSRPPKSFDRALRGLRMLKQAELPVTVRMTINRHNVNDIEDTARLLLEDVGLGRFNTNEAGEMGAARCYGDSIVLTRAERRRAMETLARLEERYKGRIGSQAGPQAMARRLAEIEAEIARGNDCQPGMGTLRSCGGVFTKMAILHDGTMVPCNLLPQLTMGVIGTHSLSEAWRTSPAINAVRYRRDIPLASLPTCRDCRYIGFCSGGCPGTVMSRYGRLHARDPLSCFRILDEEQPGEENIPVLSGQERG